MRVVLKRVWTSGSPMQERTLGNSLGLPRRGEPFRMATVERDGGPTRLIETSPVIYVKTLEPDYLRFYTENSVFELELLDLPEPEKEVA